MSTSNSSRIPGSPALAPPLSPRAVAPILALQVIAAAAALLLVLVVLEVVLRAGGDFGLAVPHRYAKGETEIYRGQDWRQSEFNVPLVNNAEGYHGPSFAAKPGRPYRVAVSGSSFIEANQLPVESNLVSLAERELPGVQLLNLGDSGGYLPRQIEFIEKDYPKLFGHPQSGKAAKYPPLDAIIFGVHKYGLLYMANSSREFKGVEGLPKRWQYRLMTKPTRFVEKDLLEPIVLAPSHAASFMATRLRDWTEADWKRTVPRVDDARRAKAAGILRDQVIQRLIDWAAQEHIRIAFLYIPSQEEVAASPYHQNLTGVPPNAPPDPERDTTLALLRASGAPMNDSTPYFAGHDDLFYATDHHPTEGGHVVMAQALRDLVRQLQPAPTAVPQH